MISRPAEIWLVKNHFGYLEYGTPVNRTILQKTFYLIQSLGVDFRYIFYGYLKGPYSPALAKDAYDAFNDPVSYKEEVNQYRLSGRVMNLFEKYKKNVGDKFQEPNWLELLSSLRFLKNNFPDKDWKGVKEILYADKPFWKERDGLVDEAIQHPLLIALT